MIKVRVGINTDTFEVVECKDYSEYPVESFTMWKNGDLQGREHGNLIYIYVDARDLE